MSSGLLGDIESLKAMMSQDELDAHAAADAAAEAAAPAGLAGAPLRAAKPTPSYAKPTLSARRAGTGGKAGGSQPSFTDVLARASTVMQAKDSRARQQQQQQQAKRCGSDLPAVACRAASLCLAE